MDEVKDRLKQAAENCQKSYEAWSQNRKDIALREALQEAVHELRKVTARLEIEIAVSERRENTQKQLPIPPHRSSKRRQNGDNGADDDIGNAGGELPSFISGGGDHQGGNDHNASSRRQGGRNRRPQRRPSGGENAS